MEHLTNAEAYTLFYLMAGISTVSLLTLIISSSQSRKVTLSPILQEMLNDREASEALSRAMRKASRTGAPVKIVFRERTYVVQSKVVGKEVMCNEETQQANRT